MEVVILLLYTEVMEKIAVTTLPQHDGMYQKMTYAFSR